jgi:hypothetical protein
MGNSNEIGKVYQVIEKWVFFKLLFANPTDSSGGKNHNSLSNEAKHQSILHSLIVSK